MSGASNGSPAGGPERGSGRGLGSGSGPGRSTGSGPGAGPGRGPGPGGGRVKEFQRASTVVFSCVFIAIGLAMIGVTTSRGGGMGYVVGALFTALGAGRLRLALRKRP